MMQPTRSTSPQLVWPVRRKRQLVRDAPEGAFTETPLVLSVDVLTRYNAQVLDPATAAQPGARRRARDNERLGLRPGQPVRYLPTAYLADQVLLSARGLTGGDLANLVRELSERLAAPSDPGTVPVRLVVEPGDLELAERRARTGSPVTVRLLIESAAEDPAAPPDAWRVVQQIRDAVDEQRVRVGLNHLMFAAAGGQTVSYGHGTGGSTVSYGHSGGAAEYALPGLGGRMPVHWLAPPPQRGEMSRRPTVAVLDTGVSGHPWFEAPEGDPIVIRFRYDASAGTVETAGDQDGGEAASNVIDPLEGQIDPFFGHGTFIAGLIRQTCPDARILSVKLMGTDGIVEEAALLNALGFLHQRQLDARAAGPEADAERVDVVSLSLGYYHEDNEAGTQYDSHLKDALDALSEQGVLVVAAAGNNATTRPLLPAGFSAYRNGALATLTPPTPLVSVGALNPDGSVALFSNDGAWIACHAPGSALVSTLPLVDSGERASIDLGDAPVADRVVGTWRATIDPDSFTGFGTWSGTSFAAPVMAGAAAQALLDGGTLADPAADPAQRAVAALGQLGLSTSVVHE